MSVEEKVYILNIVEFNGVVSHPPIAFYAWEDAVSCGTKTYEEAVRLFAADGHIVNVEETIYPPKDNDTEHEPFAQWVIETNSGRWSADVQILRMTFDCSGVLLLSMRNKSPTDWECESYSAKAMGCERHRDFE